MHISSKQEHTVQYCCTDYSARDLCQAYTTKHKHTRPYNRKVSNGLRNEITVNTEAKPWIFSTEGWENLQKRSF